VTFVETQDDGAALRIAIADDHAVVRAGLHLLLDDEDDFEVVAEADDVDTAKRAVRGHRPDVLVLDLNMPGDPSLPAIPDIAALAPEMSIVVLTMQDEPAFAREALAYGARGYVLKHAPADDMVRAVRTVAAGGVYVDPVAALDLVAPAGEELSPRESEVLTLLQDGHRSSDIARRLFISKATVRSHVRNAMTKLNARTFTQAVAEAVRRSLISA